MRRATSVFSRPLTVCSANKTRFVVLLVFLATVKIHLLAAVGAEQQSRKHAHLAQSRRSAFTLAQSLYRIESILVDYRFVRVLEHYPIFFRTEYDLLAFVRFLARAKVHGMSEIQRVGQYSDYRARTPYFRRFKLFQTVLYADFAFPYYGRIYAALGQYPRYLRRAITLQAKRINFPYHVCAVLVHK